MPRQVSAIGFDNNPISSFVKPKLTTVRYPIEEVGERAARLALAMIHAGDEESDEPKEIDLDKLMFTPDLIVRASVAPLNQSKDKAPKSSK